MMKHELFVCECHYIAHNMIISYDIDDIEDDGWDKVYVEIHLSPKLPFLSRIVHGIKYIFGYGSPTGDFDGLTINPEDADKLQDVVNYLRTCKLIKNGNRK